MQDGLIDIAEGLQFGPLRDCTESIAAALLAAAHERQDDLSWAPMALGFKFKRDSDTAIPACFAKWSAALLFHNNCLLEDYFQ